MNCYTVPSQGREGHKILSCGQRKKTVSDHHLVHNDNCVVPMNHAWLIIFTKQLGFCSICSSRKLLPPGQYALSTEYHVAYRYNHLTPPSADLLKSAMMRDGTKTGPYIFDGTIWNGRMVSGFGRSEGMWSLLNCISFPGLWPDWLCRVLQLLSMQQLATPTHISSLISLSLWEMSHGASKPIMVWLPSMLRRKITDDVDVVERQWVWCHCW